MDTDFNKNVFKLFVTFKELTEGYLYSLSSGASIMLAAFRSLWHKTTLDIGLVRY